MTRLEQIGRGVAAAMWMETPFAEGRLLAGFLSCPDQTLSVSTLDALLASPVRTRGCSRIEGTAPAARRVRAYISRLRSALADLGYVNAIRTVQGGGYFMSAGYYLDLREEIEAWL